MGLPFIKNHTQPDKKLSKPVINNSKEEVFSIVAK
jgi:hypothetical protein